MSDLQLLVRDSVDNTFVATNPDTGHAIALAPIVDNDYWDYRVPLGDKGQAVLGFKKFGLVGIGFAQEEADYNRNLPSEAGVDEIFQHIKMNKGDHTISDDDVREAIGMIVARAAADRLGRGE